MYIRNYSEEADLPWTEVFQTDDRARVEEFCREAGIEFTWKDGNRLRTRQTCQAVARHPANGKMLWFNQAHLFHVSSLDPETRQAMVSLFGEDGLPRDARFGDGDEIPLEDLEEIRKAYHAEQILFPWEEGDVLLLDNMAVTHGRTPYRGERKIRVGMSDPVGQHQIETLPSEFN